VTMLRHTLFEVVGGSHAAGLATAASDLDLYRVVTYEPSYYLGLPLCGRGVKQDVTPGEDEVKQDVTEFELRHFLGLCAKGNPTHLRLLWTTEFRRLSAAGEMLRHYRDLFSAKSAAKPFVGMAQGYYDRATQHPITQSGLLEPEQAKCMSNAYLLLHQARQFLLTGHLPVRLDDDTTWFLRDVRNGDYSWFKLGGHFDYLRKLVQGAEADSPLPDEADVDEINRMCVSVMLESWAEMGVRL